MRISKCGVFTKMTLIAQNKKARFEYHIIETYQAGLVLPGYLVKLIRGRKIKISGVFVVYQNNRLEMIGFGNEQIRENVPLLLNKREVDEIRGQLMTKGISCVPLTLKTVDRWIKADIALVKGKKTRDKRETIKKRDLDREAERGMLHG